MPEYRNTGTYYYDVSNPENMLTRIDRDNGSKDRYCGLTHHLKKQPCSQYVDHGDRYLYYPADSSCCYCCSADHGCGVLKNDWITDGSYIGKVSHLGMDVFKWNKPGLQDNIYLETMENDPNMRIPIQTDMGPGTTPDFIQEFNYQTFTTKVDPSVFTLPSSCDKTKKCPINSTCTKLRGEQQFLQ